MANEFELRKFVAPEFIFGVGALELAGRYAKNFGARHALVVTDPGIIAAGWTDRVAATLEEAHINYTVFSGVSPNPRAEEVMRGAEVYRESDSDIIVAVGGGSPMDCAKGIGIVSSNRQHILEFEGVDQVSVPIPPLICIPTTSGTSADVSQFAIIADTQEKVKIAIISKAVVPDVALIDPQTLTTMPAYLSACVGMDALVHAIEAFVSNAHSPVTDLHALEAIRLLASNLVPSLADPNNLELRSQIMLGSLEAGLAFSNASLGIVHAMAHSLGGFLDLPHGQCNAILLSHAIDFNFAAATERFQRLGAALGLDLKGKTLGQQQVAIREMIIRLKITLGIDQTLGQVGVRSSDIPDLAKKALHDACLVTNPRRPTQRDIEVLYEEAI